MVVTTPYSFRKLKVSKCFLTHNSKLLISKICTGNSKMVTDGSSMAHLHTLNSVVLGHHIYNKDIWTVRNWFVKRKWETFIICTQWRSCMEATWPVGHVPRIISTPCNVFIRKGGVITCPLL